MSCDLCSRGSRPCSTFSHHLNYEPQYYSGTRTMSEDVDDEPVAPTLSLGNRILWLTEACAASGIVRWIGRIPSVSAGWSAGIEFDNIMPSGGNGDFQGRIFFHSRPGHALFLPVSELIKVDDNSATASSNGERTSFFGRLQDSCSNFAHRRRRDSTFGHFKNECYSTCAQNDFHCNSHYYSHAPVYDRITSRRSLHYDDHPYETYNTHLPCNPLQASSNRGCSDIQKARPCVGHIRPHTREDPFLIRNEPPDERIHCQGYPENEFGEINMTRKESIFNPRASLRLISDFKEWVSCLITGTTRRKSNRKFILKDRKSVTSVFLSNNSQSLTGQRLSSFSEYASVSVSRGSQKGVKSSSNLESCNSLEQVSQLTRKTRKKRPAPLPPGQYSRVDSNKENRHNTQGNVVNGTVNQQDIQKDGRGNRIVSKTVKSSNLISHSVPLKKGYKKRRAPPPPTLISASSSSIYASVHKKGHKNIQNGTASSKYDNLYFPSVRHQHSKIVMQGSEDQEWDLANFKKHKHRPMHRKLQRMPNLSALVASNHHFAESGSDNSTSGSISFSPDESGDEKYGLVKYKVAKGINSTSGESSIPRSSNFLQYSGDNSDVCLKISIQKTETNVVTVEEVSNPHTVHYTIEEDTSSSELSDEPPIVPVKVKAINGPQESKPNPTDDSPVSTEEAVDKSSTIFEELQIEPPVKGSVKDFVHAFNMLANKSNGAGTPTPNPSVNDSNAHDSKVTTDIKNQPKNIQSFPTKWEFQNNKAVNIGFPTNQYLLPIAEESVNETSEQDGNVSVEEASAAISGSLKQKGKKNNSTNHHGKTLEVNENIKKKCSHCSEKHTSSSSHKESVPSKSLKKRVAPKYEKVTQSEKGSSSKKDQLSSQASVAALSSLLQDKTLNGEKELPNCSTKLDLKLDQPIMVGLYIEDKSSHRGPMPLLVTPSMSLRKLKKQVEAEYEFPRHQQCWILGESFAVQDEASLASYGVKEAGCPILLYVMAKESKSHSLPCRASTRIRSQAIQNSSDTSDDEIDSPRQHKRSYRKHKSLAKKDIYDKERLQHVQKAKLKDEAASSKSLQIGLQSKPKDKDRKKNKSDYHKTWEEEYEKKADYRTLLALDDVDLVANVEQFECPVCFLAVESGEGAVLQDCLHSFCRECLASSIQYADTAIIKCPFANDEYSCESHLQEREIKCLVLPELYEKHLQRSMALAESQAQDSFHCKTPDCPGWCLFEDNVNTFLCPVCKHTNCLTCAAVHEGKNCRQYQDHVAFNSDTSEEAKKTKEYLQNMVQNGEAMECPKCQVIMMKKWGCDWLKCSMCHTEVCWVTKGPRWGPGGKGDTSGGCKCMLNGVRCHPKCSYCH